MRIVIDLQGAQTASRFRGIGRYTTALTRALLRNGGEHTFCLVLNGALEESVAGIRAEFADLLAPSQIRVFDTPGRIAEMDSRAAPRCRAAELIREQFIALLAPDVVLVTSLFEGYIDDAVGSIGSFIEGRRSAVILYDLIPLLNPDSYLASASQKQSYLRKIASLKRAGRILAISDYARTEAIAALDLAPTQVVTISTAVDTCFVAATPDPDLLARLRARCGITRKMLMCAPGGDDPRKNIDGLIRAYGMLAPTLRAQHQLVIASKMHDTGRAHLLAHAGRCGLGPDELVLTGYVSDAELIALYQSATLFIFPSLHEGFGMPALEAMACGAPTIGSNSTSLPEVLGCAEAMFDPREPASIAACISAVLGDPARYARLRAHSRRQAATFSWDHTAQRALRALEAQVASSAPVHARPHRALLQALASVAGLTAGDSTLFALATSLAALPDPTAPRQWLIDLSALDAVSATADAHWIDLARTLLHSQGPGIQVAPVMLSQQGGNWHYRYAHHAAAQLLGLPTPAAPDAVADLRSGDRIFAPAQHVPAASCAQADGFFAYLARIGVERHPLDAHTLDSLDLSSAENPELAKQIADDGNQR